MSPCYTKKLVDGSFESPSKGLSNELSCGLYEFGGKKLERPQVWPRTSIFGVVRQACRGVAAEGGNTTMLLGITIYHIAC